MLRVKFLIIIVLTNLWFCAAFAQTGNAEYNWKDSSKIPGRRISQYRQFLNHQYPYPAKPRSMWEIGLGVGNAMIFGDITGYADFGGAVTIRKALSHVFSMRVGYMGGYHQGYPNTFRGVTYKVRPYQNWTHSQTLEGIASLNAMSHYRGNPKMDWYATAGLSLIETRVFFKDPTGTQIDHAYKVAYGGYVSTTPNTRGGTIATFGKFKARNGRRGWTVLGGASLGGGASVKLSKRINIGLEQKFTFVNYDYLDAYKGGNSNDIYSFTSGRININIGSSSNYVEPLWWLNPNNFVYNEINNPQHMQLSLRYALPDADGDGVTDQFDNEPNTPAGAPVDTHGVAKDTDGDGVPDYKDQELLTPLSCFPVNASGVGTCPEPICCKEIRDILDNGGGGGNKCTIGNLPSIQFNGSSVMLTADAKALLVSAASQLKASANCNVKIVGHGTANKRIQQRSWDRVNAVRKYLVETQGISESRIIFTFGQEGDENTVDLIATTESGANTTPAPFPNMRGK